MINFKKSRGGFTAKKAGALAETIFERYCYHTPDCSAVRIPDGCIQVSAQKLIRTHSPFDWVVGYKQSVIFLDTKTASTGSYSLKESVDHQIKAFEKLSQHGAISGYLVEFRGLNEYRWFSLARLQKIKEVRKSLVPKDGVLVGHCFPLRIDFELIIST